MHMLVVSFEIKVSNVGSLVSRLKDVLCGREYAGRCTHDQQQIYARYGIEPRFDPSGLVQREYLAKADNAWA